MDNFPRFSCGSRLLSRMKPGARNIVFEEMIEGAGHLL